MNTPQELKYTKDHEWLRTADDGTATVGITDYAQEKLGSVVYVELPSEGDEVTAGATCGTVESTKAASDIYTPIGGTITAVNNALEEQPELVNNEPYGAGWLFTLQPSAAAEIEQLLDAAAYAELVEGEA